MTNIDKAKSIRNHMLSTAAQCWSYNWNTEFQASELKSAATRCHTQIGRVDISGFTAADCADFGFGLWSEETGLRLIPLWLFSFIENGVELTSINGEKKVVSSSYNDRECPDYIDNDVRFGCVAWGIVPTDIAATMAASVMEGPLV